MLIQKSFKNANWGHLTISLYHTGVHYQEQAFKSASYEGS